VAAWLQAAGHLLQIVRALLRLGQEVEYGAVMPQTVVRLLQWRIKQVWQARQRGVLTIVPAMNLAAFGMMLAGAICSGSSSLLSGGLDNLGDALTYLLSLAVIRAKPAWRWSGRADSRRCDRGRRPDWLASPASRCADLRGDRYRRLAEPGRQCRMSTPVAALPQRRRQHGLGVGMLAQ
jgi:hypothetical protein